MNDEFKIILNENGEKVLLGINIDKEIIQIPSDVIHIAPKAFKRNEKITEIIFNDKLKTIGEEAFLGCLIKKLVLNDGLEIINEKAFSSCINLKEVILPSSLKQIRSKAFYNCVKLETINFPEGLETLADSAFLKCKKVLPLKLPDCLKRKRNLNWEVIEVLKGKKNFIYNNEDEVAGIKDIKNKFYKLVIIPRGVKSISNGAFYGLSIGSVVLPKSLETIQNKAFKNCFFLKRIFIPRNVKIIEKDVFACCEKLKIYCEDKPLKGWVDEEDTKKVYYDDMTDAFNFHRSSGSFDDHYVVERIEIIKNSYNPEKCPVYENVLLTEFLKIK